MIPAVLGYSCCQWMARCRVRSWMLLFTDARGPLSALRHGSLPYLSERAGEAQLIERERGTGGRRARAAAGRRTRRPPKAKRLQYRLRFILSLFI